VDNARLGRPDLVTVPDVTEVWALPGYDVQELIGYGATGEVWRAVEVASGDAVALKRLRPDACATAVDALRREVVVLRTLDTPYVVRLREVLGEGAETVLVLDLAAGGSLAALLVRRGRLDPGEVVTVAGPLASALAAAHAAGLVHGDVTPANVLFTADGMPLLSDLGVARVAGDARPVDGTAEYVDPAVAAGGLPDAAADVWALAAICHHLLAGTPPHDGPSVGDVLDAAVSGSRAPLGLLAPTAPRALVSAIEQALQADPAQRPDAAAFAALVRRSHAAAPVRLTGPAAAAPGPEQRETHAVHDGAPAGPAEPARVRWRPSRPVLLSGAAAVLVVLAAGVGWASGRATPTLATVATAVPSPPASPLPRATVRVVTPPVSTPPDFAAVLDRLDAARSAAFAAADVSQIADVYTPAAPGLATDTAAIAALHAAGRTARGVRHTVHSVGRPSYAGRVVRLRVVDVMAGYEVVGPDAAIVSRAEARGEAAHVVELVKTAAGWRIRDIRPA